MNVTNAILEVESAERMNPLIFMRGRMVILLACFMLVGGILTAYSIENTGTNSLRFMQNSQKYADITLDNAYHVQDGKIYLDDADIFTAYLKMTVTISGTGNLPVSSLLGKTVGKASYSGTEELVTVTENYQEPLYGTRHVAGNISINGTDTSYDEQYVIGYENKTRTISSWVPFTKNTMQKETTYIIRQKFTRETQEISDLIPSLNGVDFSGWAWWNTTWAKRRNATLTNWNCGLATCVSPIYIALNSSLTNGSDMRIVASDESTSLNFWRKESGIAAWNYTNASGYVFLNAPNTTTLIWIYYNGTGVSDASSIGATAVSGIGDNLNANGLNTSMWYNNGLAITQSGNGSMTYSLTGGASKGLFSVNYFPSTNVRYIAYFLNQNGCTGDCRTGISFNRSGDTDTYRGVEHQSNDNTNIITIAVSVNGSSGCAANSTTGSCWHFASTPTTISNWEFSTWTFNNFGTCGGLIDMGVNGFYGFATQVCAVKNQTMIPPYKGMIDWMLVATVPLGYNSSNRLESTATMGADLSSPIGTLTVNATTGGSATGNNSTFTPPATLPITATPDAIYVFANWTENCNGTIANSSNPNTTIEINDTTPCYAEAFFLINSSLASLTAPTITPTTAYLDSTLTCNPGVYTFPTDTENASARTWKWFVNSVETLVVTQTLPPGNFALGDTVACEETTSGNTYAVSASANSTNFTNIIGVTYINYSAPNLSGFGSGFDYSRTVMTSATGWSDGFGLMILATSFMGFYIIGSRYTQERAFAYSAFLTVMVAFLLVSGNFLDPKWLIISIIALLAAIYFANRVG